VTIYVDNMRGYARVDHGGRTVTGRWSHLLADDSDELAAFAAHLGLRPEWLQSPRTPREHYDVVEAVRRGAVAAGAVPIPYPLGTGNVIATKRLQASALDAASRTWHVFPLRPGTKVPAIRHWEHEATTDTEQVKELWTAQLRRRDGWYVPKPPNVGIACGPSGLVVLDLDLAKLGQDRTRWPVRWRDPDISSGTDVLAVLAEQVGQTLPKTYVVSTPSGGRHLYYTAPEGLQVRNSAGRPGPMIDIRGQGGYVVGDGSRLHSRPARDDASTDAGELAYRLIKDSPAVELPCWLTEVVAADGQRGGLSATNRRQLGSSADRASGSRSDGYGSAALRGEIDRVRSTPVGQRNHTLNAVAYSLGQLVAAGALKQARAVEALTDAATDAGLEAPEIAATIDSGLSAGLKRPRALPERRSAPVETGASVGSEVRGRDEAVDDVDQAHNPGRPAGVPSEQSDRLEHQPGQGSPSVGVELVSAEQPLTIEQGDIRVATNSEPCDTVDASGPSEETPDPRYTISEVDAAYAGWLFAEAWDSFWTERAPCHPADTLRIACEWEGLPTLGKSDRRFGPRPRATFIEAPGEELVDREVWDCWSQSQRDEWYFTRHERARAAATDVRGHHETVDSLTVRECTSTEGAQPAVDDGTVRAEVDRADVGTTKDDESDLRAENLTDAPYAAPSARQEPPPGEPRHLDSLTAETAPAETPDNTTPDPHMVLDEAIGQARVAVAHLEASRADSRHRSRREASGAAIHDDRPAYWTEPEVQL
jgi:hypothetical protein